MIAILDYGSGNLRSAERAFSLSGHETIITSDPEICASSDGLVVPGVGAYGACMKQLIAASGDTIIKSRVASEKPILGICVGMQILFSSGTEKGGQLGLGIFDGEISQISAKILPHIGWNTISSSKDSLLFKGVEDQSFYFVHSFAAKSHVDGALSGWSEYGEKFMASIERGSTSAVQFHPEKSGDAGARLISNWVSSL